MPPKKECETSLRAGLLRPAHVDGNGSARKIQPCVFCDTRVRSRYAHAFFRCSALLEYKPDVLIVDDALDIGGSLLRLLQTAPTDPAFSRLVLFAACLDRLSLAFWREHSDTAHVGR